MNVRFKTLRGASYRDPECGRVLGTPPAPPPAPHLADRGHLRVRGVRHLDIIIIISIIIIIISIVIIIIILYYCPHLELGFEELQADPLSKPAASPVSIHKLQEGPGYSIPAS